MTQTLSKAMIRELRSIESSGEPSDLYEWHIAGALGFHARDRVLGALLRRGLIVDEGSFRLTEEGRKCLRP